MSQRERIIKALKKSWISSADGFTKAGTLKLPTRVGELRKEGYVINDKWNATKEYKLYRIVKCPK